MFELRERLVVRIVVGEERMPHRERGRGIGRERIHVKIMYGECEESSEWSCNMIRFQFRRRQIRERKMVSEAPDSHDAPQPASVRLANWSSDHNLDHLFASCSGSCQCFLRNDHALRFHTIAFPELVQFPLRSALDAALPPRRIDTGYLCKYLEYYTYAPLYCVGSVSDYGPIS